MSSKAAITALCLLLVCLKAQALDVKKKYEQELVQWALAQKGLQPDPRPLGKVIERVEIVREEIIADSDPWPSILNYAHIKTKDHIVRREILIKPGQLWDQEKVDESARNLRKLFILATVRTLACRSQKPGHVILLVITKDLWSIRLNQAFIQVGTVLHSYETWPTEQNFLGLNRRLSLNLKMQQVDLARGIVRDSFTLGQLYVDPRIFGSRTMLVEAFSATMSGDVPCGGVLSPGGQKWCPQTKVGTPEGVYGQLRLHRPLFALDTQWAYDIWGQVRYRKVREFRYNTPSEPLPLGETEGLSLRTDPFGQDISIPRVYDARELSAGGELTRSMGKQSKHDITPGVIVYSRRYSHPANMVLAPSVLRWHRQNILPTGEDAAYLFFQYRNHKPDYIRVYNMQTFALSEDFVLGRDIVFETRLGTDLNDVSQAFAIALLAARYRWYFHDDLLTLSAGARTRLQPGLRDTDLVEPNSYDNFFDNELEFQLSNASPVLLLGRLHLRMRAILRDNVVHRLLWEPLPGSYVSSKRVSLGSSSGLRGYISGRFEGDSLWQMNTEFRTLPVNLWTLHLGMLLFYDSGVVFGGYDPADPEQELQARYQHSVGIGIRGLFPQFDKETLRIDFAVPLTAERAGWTTWFSLSFGQIFS